MSDFEVAALNAMQAGLAAVLALGCVVALVLGVVVVKALR